MGREFMHIFDDWAEDYDDAVTGRNLQYQEVFKHYDDILEQVASSVEGHTIEFGVGTGNLFHKLIEKDVPLIGIEPNESMRRIAKSKYPHHTILEGDFLNFPMDAKFDSIVSTYAFHHLTDQEKLKAIRIYYDLLNDDGKIIFADTVFIDHLSYEKAITKAISLDHFDLAQDLQREYYTTIPNLRSMFEKAGFTVEFTQLNDFVWLIHAQK